MVGNNSNYETLTISKILSEEMTAERQKNLDILMYNGMLSNDISITRLAVILGAQVNYNHLKHACNNGFQEIAQCFLDHCNCTESMEFACRSGDTEVVKFLIENDVEVSELDLEFAIIGGHTDIVKLISKLISKSTTVSTYALIIAYKKEFTEIMNILSENKMISPSNREDNPH